ncbi:IS5 family transposase [Micromonospora sp. NPDC000668]|uniref:IS5 family transposase n=1 Tax=Micromonospora sp. NPDC000668 TaxID=3364219 RepID=UPI00369284A8
MDGRFECLGVRRGEQPPWIVSDELWAEISPLLPPRAPRRRRYPGRKPLDDRKVLCGILFVLYTAIPCEHLPQELGFGSGMTCWRRLRDWNDAGVWQQLHEVLLGKLRAAGQLDMSRAVIDGSHVRALKGGPKTGPSPVDRRKPGSKHHVITDTGGIPLAVSLTGGNRHDITQLMPLIDKVPPIKGHPRQSPATADRIYADRGYDYDIYRRALRTRGITPVIARRGVDHGLGLGTRRWVVEQTIALLHWFRRLRVRWEIRDDIHEAFLTLACAIICWRRLQHSKS